LSAYWRKLRTRQWLSGERRGFCAILIFLTALASASAEPKRVLLLDSFGPSFSPYSAFIANFRRDLAQQSSDAVDFFEVSLSTARFAEGEGENPFVEYLNALFVGRRPDLVITIGAPAAGFLQRSRQRVFPSSPALFAAVDQRRLNDADLSVNDAVVAIKIDLPPLIANILEVLPQTNRVVVVIGDSPLEKFWLKAMREEFQQFSSRVEFTWLNELSLEDMLKLAAALPPRSAIFWADLTMDATGVPHAEHKALMDMHAVANAPMFSYVEDYFGQGIVGGRLIRVEELSRRAADVAVRILRGETPADIKTPPLGLGAPVYDWRELRRWDIAESSLPAGSSIQFREPTIWDQYRYYNSLAAAACALQASCITALLLSGWRPRRAHAELRRTEQAAQKLSGQLINAQEQERSRLARELHDDVTQRLALLAIDAGREEQRRSAPGANTAMRAMREDLVRLSEDVHALSYRLHPSILEDLGLIEAVKSECERFSRMCSIQLDINAMCIPSSLPRDAALCLFRIAQEGLRNIARHARAARAKISLRSLNDGLQLTISDDGVGFDPARTRKRVSLGHAGMRQRVLLLGGRVKINSSPGRGTTIEAWVPMKEEEGEQSARAVG
jgi:signal transduction histidine kinase